MAIITYGYKEGGFKKYIIGDNDPITLSSEIDAIPFFNTITYGDEFTDDSTGEMYKFTKVGVTNVWRKLSHGPA